MRQHSIEAKLNTKNCLHVGYNFVFKAEQKISHVVLIGDTYGVTVAIKRVPEERIKQRQIDSSYTDQTWELFRHDNSARALKQLAELLADSSGAEIFLDNVNYSTRRQRGALDAFDLVNAGFEQDHNAVRLIKGFHG